MTHCSIELRDRRSVTRYELLSSAKSIGKELIKKIYILKTLRNIQSKLPDNAKKVAADALKTT